MDNTEATVFRGRNDIRIEDVPRPHAGAIRIEFSHPTAAAVAIAGTFNDWRPDATQMMAGGAGHWVKEMALAPGNDEYRLGRRWHMDVGSMRPRRRLIPMGK